MAVLKISVFGKLFLICSGIFSLAFLINIFNDVHAVSSGVSDVGQDDTAEMFITPNDTLMACGSADKIIVSLQNVSELYGYQIQFNYDSNLVTPQVSFNNTFFDTSIPGGSFSFITCNAGVCSAFASKLAPAEPISGEGPIIEIILEPGSGEGGFYDMQLSNVVLSDIDGFQIPVIVPEEPLAITVCGFAEIEGVVSMEGRANPLESGSITLIDLDGNFQPRSGPFDGTTGQFSLAEIPFIPSTGSSYRIESAHQLYLPNATELTIESMTSSIGETQLLAGDADLNNAIDIVDLACVGANFGGSSFACVGIGGTDINGDGLTNIQDLTLTAANFRKAGFQPW